MTIATMTDWSNSSGSWVTGRRGVGNQDDNNNRVRSQTYTIKFRFLRWRHRSEYTMESWKRGKKLLYAKKTQYNYTTEDFAGHHHDESFDQFRVGFTIINLQFYNFTPRLRLNHCFTSRIPWFNLSLTIVKQAVSRAAVVQHCNNDTVSIANGIPYAYNRMCSRLGIGVKFCLRWNDTYVSLVFPSECFPLWRARDLPPPWRRLYDNNIIVGQVCRVSECSATVLSSLIFFHSSFLRLGCCFRFFVFRYYFIFIVFLFFSFSD